MAESEVGARQILLTSEELVVFSATRRLPVPPGVPASLSLPSDPETLRDVLHLASRTLFSRGVALAVPEEPDNVERSLRTVCSPEARFVIGAGEGSAPDIRDFALGDGMLIGHSWSDLGVHLVCQFEKSSLGKGVSAASQVSDSDDLQAGDEFEIRVSDLAEAVADGRDALSTLLSNTVDDAQLAQGLVDALLGDGRSGFALFESRDDDAARTFTLTWLDAASAGTWVVSPAAPRDDGAERRLQLVRTAPSDLREQLLSGIRAVAEYVGA